MKKINLKEFYPFYKDDTFIEVSDEVEKLLRESALLEEAYRIRTYRHKAFYSLDYGDNIERKALIAVLSSLPKKQARRIYALFFMGMSVTEIAKAEGVHKSQVTRSIDKGLRSMKKFLKNFF